jgi:hypothetical protein
MSGNISPLHGAAVIFHSLLRDAAGSQILPPHYAAGSRILPPHYVAGSQVFRRIMQLGVNLAAGSQV